MEFLVGFILVSSLVLNLGLSRSPRVVYQVVPVVEQPQQTSCLPWLFVLLVLSGLGVWAVANFITALAALG